MVGILKRTLWLAMPEVHPDIKNHKHNHSFQIGRNLERLGKAELMNRSPINGLGRQTGKQQPRKNAVKYGCGDVGNAC
jgi:hypothetical protein